MDSRRAREILALYRPGGTDAADPQMAEALDQVQRDPELAAWFEQQGRVYTALRDRLKEIPVPPDLKRRIILGRPHQHARIVPLPATVRWLAAAAALVLLGVIAWFVLRPARQDNFEHYRDRLARSVQRGYSPLDIATNDQAQLREYFRSNALPADYVLPAALAQLPAEGGGITRFENRPCEMLCLYDGLDAKGHKNGLWIFISPRNAVAGAPPPGKPEFLQVGTLMTASWTTGDMTYLLAVAGDEKAAQKYLQ